MNRRNFLQSVSVIAAGMGPLKNRSVYANPLASFNIDIKRKLFIYGGPLNKAWLTFIAGLTKTNDPKICFVPTAGGDNERKINFFYSLCEDLPLRPYILKAFIESPEAPKTFEEILMSMNAVVVSGGNTLNMLSIWKAQGIDLALRKAYDSGIIISGGSAGSLCWFQNGITDSRPVNLTKIEGLGWIKGSHCPHYNTEKFRKPLYHELIKKGDLFPGYACDEFSGLYFENEKVIKCYALDEKNKSYYVDLADGKIIEKEFETEIL